MTVTVEAPAAEAPLFIEPTPADKAARRVEDPKPVPVDPDAPYGWMVDPKTGEKRPKKTAGRQPKGRKAPAAAPRQRPAAAPRTRPAPPGSVVPAATHMQMVADLIGGVRMMGVAIPSPEPREGAGRFMGMDLRAFALRSKAVIAVMHDNRQGLSQGIGTIADHVPVIGRGVEYMARDDGPGWIIPATVVLLPFVGACKAVLAAPLDQVATLAEKLDRELAQEMQAAGIAMLPERQRPSHAPQGAMYPGEIPLPGMDAAAA